MTKNNFDNVVADKQQDKASNAQFSKEDRKSVRATIQTAKNNIVDVFEFEPVGFMSKGRW